MENIKVKDAADLVGGIVIGDGEAEFSNVARIQEAGNGDLTFLSLPAYQKHLKETKATAVLIKPEFEKSGENLTYIEVGNPNAALQKILMTYFYATVENTGMEKSAVYPVSFKYGKDIYLGHNVVIGENCVFGDNVKIMHNTVIMDNSVIGDNTLLYPNVTLRENTVIGKNVIIHSNSVLGSDGFGFLPDEKGVYHKVPQIGNVVVEDDVEIGSNVSIDRAALGSTVIRKGTKIDNLVQIAHNVEVGTNTVISAQTGISGSSKVGNNCILAGQVGLAGHLEVADNVIIGAQSGISKSLKKPGKYFGYPAKEMGQALKLEAHIRNLPSYSDKLKKLEAELAGLKELLNTKKDR